MSFSNADTGSKPADPYKEKNKQDDVDLKTKIDDFESFINSTKFGMMTTRIASTGDLASRAMAVAAKESGGIDLIFHTNTESGKTDDLASDTHINMSFIDSSGQWASVSGESAIITDRAVVEKYYSSSLKAWMGDLGDGVHDGGPKDPRIGVIKIKAKTITYAVNHKSLLSRGAEVAKGAITGKAAQVNTLREISPEEIQKWRTANS